MPKLINDKSPTSRPRKNKTKIIPTKGPWKKNEDDYLRNLVLEYGPKNWSYIATKMNDQGIKRLGKQCRERWYNHLSPDVRKDPWTDEEDKIIIDAHNKFGSKWTAISSLLKGRTPNAIKNRWNSTLKRVLLTGGTVKKKRKSTDEKSLFVEKLPEEIPNDHIQLKKRKSNNDIFSGTNNECITDMLFNESLDSLGSGENDFFHSPTNPYYIQLISPMENDFYHISPNNFFTNTSGLAVPHNTRREEPSSIESNPNFDSPRNDAASPRINTETHEFWNDGTIGTTERESNLHHWTEDYVPMHENQINWIV
jgi:hypothetical protein